MNPAEQERRIPEGLLQAEDLPSIPAVAVEVLRLCREEETTLEELATALSYDPVLSARLLRFSNSSLYNLGGEVSTLNRAALVLGMKTVQLMALSFSLASSLPRENGKNRFDYDRFWRRSVVRAVTARTLASLARTMTEDEAFLCGLLGEFGQIVLAQCLGKEYDVVLERAGGSPNTGPLEREVFGYDHADVAGALLESWQFPTLVSRTLRALHHPDGLPADAEPHLGSLVNVLTVASHVTDLLTGEDPHRSLRAAEERGKAAFGLDADALHAFVMSLESSVRETSEMLSVRLPHGRLFEQILAEARGEFLMRTLSTAKALTDDLVAHGHRTRLRQDPSLLDAETGVMGQSAFHSFLEGEIDIRLSGALDRPLGCLWIEVDRLAQIESVFGAEARTEILRLVGSTLSPLVRRIDLIARVEGDRFAVMLSEATLFGLRGLAERLRRSVEQASLESPLGRVATTITIGGACLGNALARSDGAALVEAARRCLERAKSLGRNRTVVHGALLRAKSA